MIDEKGLYAKALSKFRADFIPAHRDKTFTSDDVHRFFELSRKPNAVEAKKAFGDVLYNLSHVNKLPELEQTGKTYRFINRELNVIHWENAVKGDLLKVNWPRGVEDESSFSFADTAMVYPGDLITLAGEGNTAKTAFALNFIVENMDTYPCYYFTSEFNDAKFVDRMAKFTWVNVFKEDGSPKFVVAEHPKDWQDVIQKDAINVIDWIYLSDEMWKMRDLMKSIIAKLDRGIALVIIQKRSYKQVGEGGEATVDLSSVYFTIHNDKELRKLVMKAHKVKSHGQPDPNYKQWSFQIVDGGSKFYDIKEIE